MKTKYIVGILLILVCGILLWNPCKDFICQYSSSSNDTLASSSADTNATTHLLPINQIIKNTDSDLELTRKFDRAIHRFMQKWEVKGASFALMKNNCLIYSKGYGFADVEENIPMDVIHIFRIASVSKLITAVAIMKLQEEGKLHLDQTVFGEQGILNDSIFGNIKDKRCRKITVEQLLRHQGGFSIAYRDPMFNPLNIAKKMNVPPPADLNTMIRFVLSRRLGYTPGQSTKYSNIGYGILSKVIEKVSGEDYETYIRKHILYPAGCYDMHLGKNLHKDRYPNEVKYYEVSNADLIPACDGSGEMVLRSNGGNNIEELYGAGGWVASPTELLRFLATIDNNPEIPDILSPSSIKYMTCQVKNALPIGWMETNKKGDWTRTGTLAGCFSLMKKQADGYSWVFLTNTSSWKGPNIHNHTETAIHRALKTVKEWPQRNLFEMQNMEYEKLLVIQ